MTSVITVKPHRENMVPMQCETIRSSCPITTVAYSCLSVCNIHERIPALLTDEDLKVDLQQLTYIITSIAQVSSLTHDHPRPFNSLLRLLRLHTYDNSKLMKRQHFVTYALHTIVIINTTLSHDMSNYKTQPSNCFVQSQLSLCFAFLKALTSPSCCASWPSSSRTFRFLSLSLQSTTEISISKEVTTIITEVTKLQNVMVRHL